jgi:hypothetical protein
MFKPGLYPHLLDKIDRGSIDRVATAHMRGAVDKVTSGKIYAEVADEGILKKTGKVDHVVFVSLKRALQ